MNLTIPLIESPQYTSYMRLKKELLELNERRILKLSDFQMFCYKVIDIRSHEGQLLVRRIDGITKDAWILFDVATQRRIDFVLVRNLHLCQKYIDVIKLYVETMQMCVNMHMPAKYLSFRKFLRNRRYDYVEYMKDRNISFDDVLPEIQIQKPLTMPAAVDLISKSAISKP